MFLVPGHLFCEKEEPVVHSLRLMSSFESSGSPVPPRRRFTSSPAFSDVLPPSAGRHLRGSGSLLLKRSFVLNGGSRMKDDQLTPISRERISGGSRRLLFTPSLTLWERLSDPRDNWLPRSRYTLGSACAGKRRHSTVPSAPGLYGTGRPRRRRRPMRRPKESVTTGPNV